MTVPASDAPTAQGRLTGRSRLVFHLADPVAQVKAPDLFNTYFVQRGLDALLVPVGVNTAHLSGAFAVLSSASNVAGLLITMPHKRAAVALCDELTDRASRVGSVNAVRFDEGRSIGEMLDGVGLLGALARAGLDVTGRRVLIVGCGGAGRAIAFAVAEGGVSRLTLSNRTSGTALLLATELRRAVPGLTIELGSPLAGDHDVVINATSLGMHVGDALPIDLRGVTSECVVVDIVTSPPTTALMQRAEHLGCTTVGGAEMLRGQTESLSRFWFGQPLPDGAICVPPRQTTSDAAAPTGAPPQRSPTPKAT